MTPIFIYLLLLKFFVKNFYQNNTSKLFNFKKRKLFALLSIILFQA